MSRRALARIAWLCHGALLVAVVLGLIGAESIPLEARIALTAGAALPLIGAVPGLLRGRRYTYQWLAFALVGYAGVAAVEVVASLGRSPFASLALLAALLELALLFTLNRVPPRANRG